MCLPQNRRNDARPNGENLFAFGLPQPFLLPSVTVHRVRATKILSHLRQSVSLAGVRGQFRTMGLPERVRKKSPFTSEGAEDCDLGAWGSRQKGSLRGSYLNLRRL